MKGDDPKGSNSNTPATKSVLTAAEVAEYLEVGKSTIYRMLRDGELPAFQVGVEWRFSTDSIAKWIRDREQVPQPLKRRRRQSK